MDTRVTAQADAAVPQLAQAQYDQGAVDPSFQMDDLMLLVKPSAAQQFELNTLLAEQQNPASTQFRKWLRPEEFGDRFGLNASDHSKLVAWLQSEGFTVRQSGRAHNWIAFGGTAAQVQSALHTAIHRYRVNGEMHFANAVAPSVPAALAEVVGGFSGLHNFNPRSPLKTIQPDYTLRGAHFLVPEDWATIYDVGPLYAAGIDGTGVSIGIIGGSQLVLSDIATFRSNYNLPAKAPIPQLAGNNPGIVASPKTEADLDIEWSGAIAPNATVYFYYSTVQFNSIVAAIDANLVQIISMSFGESEYDAAINSLLMRQAIFQQANAQGITMIAATGDSGAITVPDSNTNATQGPVVASPASYPETTAVGGSELNEGTGTYWSATNSPNSGSALSYIPEIAWSNGGGGASAVFPKPAWQTGPGVPDDGARDVPDVAFSASSHDGYYIVTSGNSMAVAGTSASAPSMAGVVALLNHYLMANGSISRPGLGNINPQLYRLAQNVPAAFHDITQGSNAVTCEQGTPGCQGGTFGYSAGPGYDQTTGIGSIDVNMFVTSWNSASNAVNVTLTATPAQATFNDIFQVTAVVTPVSGAGVPTGTVNFAAGTTPLGTVTLDASSGQATAILNLPGYLLGSANTFLVSAQYGGDTSFSSGGATTSVSVAAPTSGVSSIVPSAPISVAATNTAAGPVWQFSITLRETGGVAAVLTDFTMDGQDQPLASSFPSPNIAANSSITSQPIMLQNLAYFQAHTFGFSGVDASGATWSRQISITFLGPQIAHQVLMSAVPLTVQQNPTSATCPWPQQVILSEQGGFAETITGITLGKTSLTGQIPAIFGTTQLAAYRTLQGNLCWPNESAGSSDTLVVTLSSGLRQSLTVSFAGPAQNPSPVSVTPASVTLSTALQAGIAITAPDGQSWSASIFPQNLFTNWLTLSQSSGSGAAQITLQVYPTALETGVYLATVVIQGPNMSPPAISVPVMFVNGDSSAMTITSLTNSASGQSGAAPGMTATVTGTGLANVGFRSSTAAFTYPATGTPSGYGLTVNGIPAAFKSISPTQIVFQIPYETGAGPAVLGVNNIGSIGGFLFQVTPSAPGIYVPTMGVQTGSPVALTITGDGVTNPVIADGAAAPGSALMYKTALPFTLTIGGTTVPVTSYGIGQGAVGVTTLNATVPASLPAGPQSVVVTVGGVPSPPVTLNVTAGP